MGHLAGEPHRVGDDDHREAVARQGRPSRQKDFAPVIRGSSALVGSSKRIARGSIARARAIATRCCWPPDSSPGIAWSLSSRPTRSSKVRARASACVAIQPQDVGIGALGDVLQHRPVREQVEPLEDHADAAADPACRIVARALGLRAGVDRIVDFQLAVDAQTRPDWNGSRPLMQRRNVLLPLPDGPMIAATSPRATSRQASMPRSTSRPPCRLISSRDLDHARPPPPLAGEPPSRRSDQRENHDRGTLIAM